MYNSAGLLYFSGELFFYQYLMIPIPDYFE